MRLLRPSWCFGDGYRLHVVEKLQLRAGAIGQHVGIHDPGKVSPACSVRMVHMTQKFFAVTEKTLQQTLVLTLIPQCKLTPKIERSHVKFPHRS